MKKLIILLLVILLMPTIGLALEQVARGHGGYRGPVHHRDFGHYNPYPHHYRGGCVPV